MPRGPVQIADHANVHVRKARGYYQARQYHRARATARLILRGHSKNIGALSILGWSEYQLGRYREAGRSFRQLVRLAPQSSDGLIGLGWSNFKVSRLEAARRRFKSARPFAVGDQRYIVADGLGWISFAERKLDEAERHFKAAAEQRARGRIQHDRALGLAWVAMARGDFDAARGHLKVGLAKQPHYFRLHDGLGRVAFLQGNHAGAVRHALDGLKLVRFNRELFLLLDAALKRQSNHRATAAVYTRLIKAFPDIPDYYNGLGWAELRGRRPRRAEANFLIAIQMRRPYSWAQAGLLRAHGMMHAPLAKAWALYTKGDYLQALAAFSRHMRLAGRNPAVQTGRGWSLLALGRADKAKAAFAAAIAVDGNFKLAREGLVAADAGYRTAYLLGWDHAAAKRYAKARVQFNRAQSAAPPAERWRITEALGWLDIWEGRPAQAKMVFEGILRQHAKSHLSRKGLGYVALAERRYTQAATQLRASYRLKQKQVVTSYTVPADRLNDAGKFRLAREILELGAQVYPRDAGILFQLSRTYAGLGEQRRAALLAKRAIRLSPRGVNLVFDKLKLGRGRLRALNRQLAHGLFFAGDNKNAFRRFNAAVQADRSDVLALRGRAFALFRLKRYGASIRDLNTAIKAEPARLRPVREVVLIPGTGQRWPIVYNVRSTLAWAYFRTKRYQDAVREFRQVIKNHPGWIDAHTGLAYSLQKLGDRAGAHKSFRTALLISPGYPDAWQGLKALGADR